MYTYQIMASALVYTCYIALCNEVFGGVYYYIMLCPPGGCSKGDNIWSSLFCFSPF